MDKTLILDISSDDEVGFDDSSTADNFDWISKLFDDTPLDNDINFVSNCGGCDDDDVVVVGETISNPKKAKVSLSECGFNNDDDDDDCIVLDCDPDKKDKVETTNCDDRGNGGGDNDDELVVVGEKGQVACRDYPHSRHLCAKFPFSSTPHHSRCDLCHCYVCDSLAPCANWGSGVSTIDHCHANDKEEYWQLERKKVRQSKNGPTPVPKPSATTMLRFPRLPQNSMRVHQATTRPPSSCGVSPSFGRPNIISQGRTPRPNMTMPRTRFQPHLVSQQLVKTCNSSIQSNRGPTLPSMHPVFKRCGYLNRGPSDHLRRVVNRRANSSVNTSLTNVTPTNGLPSPLPAFSQMSGFQGCGVPSAVTSDSLYVSTSVNQTQNVSTPTVFQYSSDSPNCDTPSSQLPSTVISDGLFVGTSVDQTQNVSTPTVLRYSSDSPNCETPSSQQPYAVISDSLYASTPVNQTPYVSSPGVLHQYSIDAPNSDAQSNQQPSADNLYVSTSVNQYSYASNCYTQSNQQPSAVLPNATDQTSHGHPSNAPNYIAENAQPLSDVTHNLSDPSSLFQGAICQPLKDGLQNLVPLPFNDLSSPNEQNPPLACNTSSIPLELDIESWLSDNEPVIGTQDGSYFCDMNNQSGVEVPPVDTGMLYFDFETSWKGLTYS